MVDYDALIGQHLKHEQRPKGVGRYYPSEVGYCLRRVWYSYTNPKPVAEDKARIFEMGNILHSFMVEVFKSERTPEVELLQEEMPVKLDAGDFLVSGRVDDLLLVKDAGRPTLVEVKSTSHLGFVSGVQQPHMMQLQFYMHATGVHNGVVLYVEKNSLKAKAFEMPYDDRVASDAMARFTLLHRALLDNAVPAPEAKQREQLSWQCRFCDYRGECDRQEAGGR